MRYRHSGLHAVHLRVQRAETHCLRKLHTCAVRIAAPDPDEPAEEPGSGQIGIEDLRPVEPGEPAIEVASPRGDGVAGAPAGDRIVLAPFHDAPAQPRSPAPLLRRVLHTPLLLP